MVSESDLLWTPSAAGRERSHVTAFTRWLERKRDLRTRARRTESFVNAACGNNYRRSARNVVGPWPYALRKRRAK